MQEWHKRHYAEDSSDSDTDGYNSEGDTKYTENQRRIITLHPAHLTAKNKTLFPQTPSMGLGDAMKFAQSPKTITTNQEQLDRLTDAIQNIVPKVNLKLADV